MDYHIQWQHGGKLHHAYCNDAADAAALEAALRASPGVTHVQGEQTGPDGVGSD